MSRTVRRLGVLLLLNFVGAALMPLVLEGILLKKNESFSDVQVFGIGALTFIALALVETVIRLEDLRGENEVRQNLVRSRNAVESDLASIRDVAYSEGQSLMGMYCARSVRALRSELEAAVGSSEIQVDERSLYLTDFVVDQMRGKPTDVVRLVHRFADNAVLLRAHELEWIRKVDERARRRQVVGVRRLFVFNDEKEIELPVSRFLLAAHQSDRFYMYRLIRSDYLAELLKDHGVPTEVEDFGIYGLHTVFKGMSYDGQGLEGRYTVQPEEIQRFVSAFDACWESAVASERKITARAGEHLPKSVRDFLASASQWSASPDAERAMAASSTARSEVSERQQQ